MFNYHYSIQAVKTQFQQHSVTFMDLEDQAFIHRDAGSTPDISIVKVQLDPKATYKYQKTVLNRQLVLGLS